MSDLLSLCLVIALLGAILQIGSILGKNERYGELSRKAVHVGMGIVCLSFPWIFKNSTTVLALGLLSALALGSLRFSGSSFARALFCVKRRSIGEICFPLGVATVFMLSPGAHVYVPAVAILTIADALSALLGMKYGTISYRTEEGLKTVEGSLVFFIAALAVSMISLGILTSLSVNAVVLISITLALAATVIEGMCWAGLDNFFVPLGSMLILTQLLKYDHSRLSTTAFGFSALLALVLFLKRKSTLQGGACLAVSVYIFASFLFANVLSSDICASWFLLPLIFFAGYRRLLPRRFSGLVSAHSISGVLSVASVGVWMLCSRGDQFLYPYAIALAVHGAIIAGAHVHLEFPLTGKTAQLKFAAILKAGAKSWLLVFLPYLVASGPSTEHLIQFGMAPILIYPAVILFAMTTRAKPDFRTSSNRWIKQTACAGLGSLLALMATF